MSSRCTRLHVSGTGHLTARDDGRFGFVAIELTAAIRTDEHVRRGDGARAAKHAGRACLVSMALDVPVHVEAIVEAALTRARGRRLSAAFPAFRSCEAMSRRHRTSCVASCIVAASPAPRGGADRRERARRAAAIDPRRPQTVFGDDTATLLDGIPQNGPSPGPPGRTRHARRVRRPPVPVLRPVVAAGVPGARP